MTLVENWKSCLKWFSVQSMVLAGAIQTAWLTLPEDLKASVPPEWVTYVTMALMISGVFGRLVDQGSSE